MPKKNRNIQLGDKLYCMIDANRRFIIPKSYDKVDTFLSQGYQQYIDNNDICIEFNPKVKMAYADSLRITIKKNIMDEINIAEGDMFLCKMATDFRGIRLSKIEGDIIGK